MPRFRGWWLAAVTGILLLGATQPSPNEVSPDKPSTATLEGLPATEGRQILAADDEGNAYVVQLVDQRVFEIDELTGRAHFHSHLESDSPISGALRAAAGAEGKTWIFGFAPHFVRVFSNGEELEIEQPGAVVSGMTVVRGRPSVALAPVIPEIGTNVGRDSPLPQIPPLVMKLDEKGAWQPWIDRDPRDLEGADVLTVGILGFETRLATDEQGRLLMARRYRYDIREYEPSGKLSDRLVEGDVELAPIPEEVVRQLEEMGRSVDRDRQRPKSLIEGVAWSPEGEVLILAKTEDGYALDRWIPSLQEHARLSLEELEHPPSPLQMASTRNGLLFLPAADSKELVVVPWEFLRGAPWQSLEDEAPDEAPKEAG